MTSQEPTFDSTDEELALGAYNSLYPNEQIGAGIVQGIFETASGSWDNTQKEKAKKLLKAILAALRAM